MTDRLLQRRGAGVLLPLFSLPGLYGIGTMGAAAYRFVMTMPGLPRVPAAENIDVDENGVITGLF